MKDLKHGYQDAHDYNLALSLKNANQSLLFNIGYLVGYLKVKIGGYAMLLLLIVSLMIACNKVQQQTPQFTNDTDVLVADETYWIMPQDDEFGRSMIFSFNEHYTEQLDDFKGVELLMEEAFEDYNVTWFMITDTNLTGNSIINTIDERCKPHICKDINHTTCDGNCDCDGFECK